MFHRNRNQQQQDPNSQQGGHHWFGKRQPNNTQSTSTTTTSYGPSYGPRPAYYRDPYSEGSTRSDWDHYAVRHEEALIGDPLPIVDNGLNLASNRYNGNQSGGGNVGPMGVPLNYNDSAYGNKGLPRNVDKYGNPLIGPVTANGPLAGNYSSGTLVERNLVQGPGRRTRTGFVDDYDGGRQYSSAAWGSEPLYGNRGGYGAEPLYGYRDSRDRATPLLPDNPWTHNELGRDYEDAYRTGTLAYSSINNVFTAPPVTESFTRTGPNGELIEGTRTTIVREEIVPPVGDGLGTTTSSTSTKIVKDHIVPQPGMAPRVGVVIPIEHDISSETVSVHNSTVQQV